MLISIKLTSTILQTNKAMISYHYQLEEIVAQLPGPVYCISLVQENPRSSTLPVSICPLTSISTRHSSVGSSWDVSWVTAWYECDRPLEIGVDSSMVILGYAEKAEQEGEPRV